ncbi:MAG: hypothetical protein CSA66_01280 [Proteobacteria bacterium]|nr:MAG: hypothetical protein CSA66_01280 [Pseudomonadota bacterium]
MSIPTLPALACLTLLAACAASVPVTPLATRQDLDYAGAERFVDVDGRRVAYTDSGGAGPPLLFVHPWAGNLAIWDAVAPRFEGRFRVLRVDLPGHGKSEGLAGAYGVEAVAASVTGLVDALDLDGVTLIGNSLGGGVALAVVRDRPQRVARLVLVDALGGGAVPGLFAVFIRTYFTPAMFAGVDDGLVELFSDWFVFEHDTAGNRRFLSDLLSTRAGAEGWAWARAVADTLRDAVDYDATPWLGDVAAPTLVVWGDDDWVIWSAHAQHLAERIPDARLVVLDDCGHMPEVDCPQALAEALDTFLEASRRPPD